jgi:hypothetical protein
MQDMGLTLPPKILLTNLKLLPLALPIPVWIIRLAGTACAGYNGEIFSKSWSPTGYLTRKHQQPFNEIPINLKGDGSIDYTAIRYADVLLWYAEALNELGRGAEAIQPINQIRKRARESYLYDDSLANFGAIPTDLLPDIIYTDQAGLRAQIQHERRVEFGFGISSLFRYHPLG